MGAFRDGRIAWIVIGFFRLFRLNGALCWGCRWVWVMERQFFWVDGTNNTLFVGEVGEWEIAR